MKSITWSDYLQNCSAVKPDYYWDENDPDVWFCAWDKAIYVDGSPGDPCHPMIAVPACLRNTYPQWRTCDAPYMAELYEPPKILRADNYFILTMAALSEIPDFL